MKIITTTCFLALYCVVISTTTAFSAVRITPYRRTFVRNGTRVCMAKGFGTTDDEPRKKSEGQKKREQERSTYDDISYSGGQEYNIFVRQFGSDDTTWLPTGSIAVPRGAQVSDAIYANEEGIKSSIVRTYPKLKGSEQEFEFGFNLKIYPDDQIEVAVKSTSISSGPSIGNWISNLLSPIDSSNVQ